MPITPAHLEGLSTFEQLAELFHQELGWPRPDWPTFQGVAALYDLAADDIPGVEFLAAVEKLNDDQTWGIFLVDFGDNELKRQDLRRILHRVADRARQVHANPTWPHENILFVCRSENDTWTLAHYRGDALSNATLKVFSWTTAFVGRTVIQVNLPALHWEKRATWADAWSTLAVTNEFFKAYESFFNRWYPQIQVTTGNRRCLTPDQLKDIKVHLMQRAMNRLLFLTFLSKKGWLEFEGTESRPRYLQDIYVNWKAIPTGERFYENRLAKLFFEALAKEDDRVREQLQPLLGRVPYLNGGLFERKHWEEVGDGNTDTAILPEGMFEDLLGPSGLLSAYNFTVVESYDETDQDIAVDPEMLGRIFEKLVLDRRDEGKYYTPRMVVRFMCRESLKRVLGDGYDPIIEAPNLKAKREEAAKLTGTQLRHAIETLRDIKVVDPACGSGAYLLGMLHELFDLILAVELQLNERTEAERYQLKLQIIERNIYGVDMDDFATNIAMLRLWLSLVVDRNENPLDQPGADVSLPNLRFKICNGDSLSAPDPQVMNLMTAEAYPTHAHRLGELHDEYFLPDRRRTRPKADCLLDINNELRALDDVLEENPAPAGAFDWRRDFAEVFAPTERTGSIRGFDIVLGNPPYGVKVDDSVRYMYFDRRTEGAQSKDSYGIFMARALHLLKPGGVMCYIVSDTWRTIKSHLPLRRRLASQTSVEHFIELPGWIFDATVNTGILTLVNARPREGHKVIAADLRPVSNGDWRTLDANLSAIAHHGPDLQSLDYARYSYPQSDIATYENCSFFIAKPKLYRLMSDPRFQKLGDIAEVKQGLATADNGYYLRKRPGVRGSYQILDESTLLTDEEIAGLSDDEKRNGVDPTRYGGRHFVPYDKGGESDADGGWMPNYWVPSGYFIDWSLESVNRLRTATIADVKRRKGEHHRVRASDETTRAAVIRNPQFYFRPGITFSWAGAYSPTFRYNAPTPFDHGSSSFFSDQIARETALGLCCSRLARYIMRQFTNHTVNFGVDDVADFIIPADLGSIPPDVATLVEQIADKQKTEPRYPYHLHEQLEIDRLVHELYGLNDEDVREVTLWFCRRYRTLARAQGVLTHAQSEYADHLARCELIISKPAEYWRSHPVLTLIAAGENATVEFKQSLEYVDPNHPDLLKVPEGQPRQKKLRENMDGVLHSALKTICAFLNSQGGTLLIGVHDKLGPVGIEPDIAMIQKEKDRDADGFERKLRELMFPADPNVPKGRFNRSTAFPDGNLVNMDFPVVDGRLICQVTVSLSSEPFYLDGEFFIRDGNRTVVLTDHRRDEYIAMRRGRP